MFDVMVFYFNANKQVVPKYLTVMANSKDEALKMASQCYIGKTLKDGVKYDGVIVF